jgi:hypothetical protein
LLGRLLVVLEIQDPNEVFVESFFEIRIAGVKLIEAHCVFVLLGNFSADFGRVTPLVRNFLMASLRARSKKNLPGMF